MKTINLFVGHGSGDPGASYYGKQEHAEASKFQNALKKHLDTNFKDHATKVIIEGNFATGKINYNLNGTGGLIKGACDFGFTLHFNAFTSASANGSEMYNAGERGNGFANYVLSEMAKLGFTNRGLKPEPFALYNLRNGGDYYWEACFISNKRDMELWSNNFNKIVAMVGNKIASELALPKKTTTPKKVWTAKVVTEFSKMKNCPPGLKGKILMEVLEPTGYYLDKDLKQKDTAPAIMPNQGEKSQYVCVEILGWRGNYHVHKIESGNGKFYYVRNGALR